MKVYMKILAVTVAVQAGCMGIVLLMGNTPVIRDKFSSFITVLFFLNFIITAILDIWLAVRWGKTIREKLICIFLMPTNYTWILFFLLAYKFLLQWMDILSHMPENFG